MPGVTITALVLCLLVSAQSSQKTGRESKPKDPADLTARLIKAHSNRVQTALEIMDENQSLVTPYVCSKLIWAAQEQWQAHDLERVAYFCELARAAGALVKDKAAAAETLFRAGLLYEEIGDFLKSEQSLIDSKAICEREGLKIELLYNLSSLGGLYIRLSRYDEAASTSQRCLALAASPGSSVPLQDQFSIAFALGTLASVASWKGQPDNALKYARQSLDLFQRIDNAYPGNSGNVMDRLMQIGSIYYGLGSYDDALSYYYQALTLSQKGDYKDRQELALNYLGVLYLDQGDFPKAREYFERYLRIASEIKNKDSLVAALTNIGYVSERSGDYEEAEKEFRQALKAAADETPDFIIPILQGLGAVCEGRHQYKDALSYYEQGLTLASALGDKTTQFEMVWRKASTYYRLGNFTRSLALSKDAARLAGDLSFANYSYLALTLSGKALIGLGEYGAASETLQRAIDKAEQIRGKVAGQDEERALFFERKIEPYYLMADLLLRQNRIEEALELVERCRSRALRDAFGDRNLDIERLMSPQQRTQKQQLDQRLTSLNTQLYNEYKRRKQDVERIADLKREVDSARVNYDSFLDGVYDSMSEGRARSGPRPAFSLADAEMVIASPDAAVLEFLVLENATYLFTLIRSQSGKIVVKAHRISISKTSLLEKVEEFRERIANRSLGVGVLGRELYHVLLAPAETELAGRTMIAIVPDGALWDLPFQALRDSNGNYLVEKHSVQYEPSIAVLRDMMSRRASSGSDSDLKSAPTLLAFGDPAVSAATAKRAADYRGGESLGSLPAAAREVEALERLYGASQSRVFIGAAATEETAKATMEEFSVLHFATHGILDANSPLYSYLVLSQGSNDQDGLLEAREIMNMRLKADIAVLSACQTARGRISAGEGVIGISWALFVAGCPTTVVSQWNVESESTSRLMVDFHKRLLQKNVGSRHIHNAAQALREAQLDMIKDAALSHPFYWAGFIVVGDGW